MIIDKQTMLFHNLTDEEAHELCVFGERLMLEGDVSNPPDGVEEWLRVCFDTNQRLLVMSTVLPGRIFYSLLLRANARAMRALPE